MKRHRLVPIIFVIGCTLLLVAGCNNQAKEPSEPETFVTEPDTPVGPAEANTVPDVEKKSPRIKFEKVVHDFGDVSPDSTHRCEFKFKNIGDGLLKLNQPTSSCICTVAKLDKTEFAPGESGVVRVTKFHVPKQQGIKSQPLTIQSNDKKNPKVRLTIKARVALQVKYTPKELKLLLNDESANPEITLTSIDGRTFAISSVKATTRAITADYDSSIKAKTHTIQLKVSTNKLRNRLTGYINIKLTHPGHKEVRIPFKVLAKFTTEPATILLHNVNLEEPIRRTLWLLNNYGEDFEVESVSSEKGLIKVLKRERVKKRYKFELEITPPADTGKKRFADVFHINIKGGEKLKVNCNGFYPMNKTHKLHRQ